MDPMAPRPPLKSPAFPYYELHLSLRYLRSRFSSVAALLSVTFGVGVILVVLSIMGGYMDVLRETIRGQESHLMVMGMNPFSVTNLLHLEEVIERVKNVKGTSPFIESLGMYRSGQLNPCQLRGVQPGKEAAVSDIGRYVLRPEELEAVLERLGIGVPERREPDAGSAGKEKELKPAVALVDEILKSARRAPLGPDELERFFDPAFGADLLAKRNPRTLEALEGATLPAVLVGIHFLLERKVILGQAVEVGTIRPETQEPVDERFLIAGAFKTGDFDFDSRAIFVHVDALKNLLDLFDPKTNSYRYEGVRVAVDDLSRLQQTRDDIREALVRDFPGLRVISWEQLRGNMLTAVLIEKFVIYFLLVLLMSFTGCMVLLMLLLTVIEKTRDMGVLLALGATPGGVVRIFLANGLMIVATGTFLGLAIGYFFCIYINPIHDWIRATTGWTLFPAEIYHMDRIPITFQLGDVLLSIAPPVVLGFLSSLIPAVWASRRDPIKAIHYE